MERGERLLICQAIQKSPEDYEKIRRGNVEGKAGNPSCPHGLNYVIRAEYLTNFATLERIKAQDEEEMAKLEDFLREKGLSGEFIVKRTLGGPGRRGRNETKEEWLSKRQSGMPEIARIEVD